jgi:hypothetical protein
VVRIFIINWRLESHTLDKRPTGILTKLSLHLTGWMDQATSSPFLKRENIHKKCGCPFQDTRLVEKDAILRS